MQAKRLQQSAEREEDQSGCEEHAEPIVEIAQPLLSSTLHVVEAYGPALRVTSESERLIEPSKDATRLIRSRLVALLDVSCW